MSKNLTSPKKEISPKDVIKWLVTQPSANGKPYSLNVARQYVYNLRSAPLKLDLQIKPEDRNVFTCNTVADLTSLWDTFKSAPNYKLINKNTTGQFSAGLGCMQRYLESLSDATNSIQQESTLFTYNVKPAMAKKITQILMIRFSNGFRLNSPIELSRFRKFAEENDHKIMLSDEELTEAIRTCGTYFESKIYAVSPEAKNRIKKIVNDYLSIGMQVIFYSEFYAKNESWLFEASIISDKMLMVVLSKMLPELKFTLTYFGLTDLPVLSALECEIFNVWGNDVLLTYNQLAERLQYIPMDRIKYTLGQNNDFIWNNIETFSHISKININEEERKNIRNTAKKKCAAHGFISFPDLPIETIAEHNHYLSITAIHNAVFRICLSDKYDRKGKIIFQKGDTVDASSIIRNYCQNTEKCTLKDLLNLEEELTGEVHRWLSMEAGNKYLIRIDKNTYVADKYVYFDIDKIDGAIKLFMKSDYLPLKSFSTFVNFPDCGQVWNLFLLESYCRRFSRGLSI